MTKLEEQQRHEAEIWAYHLTFNKIIREMVLDVSMLQKTPYSSAKSVPKRRNYLSLFIGCLKIPIFVA